MHSPPFRLFCSSSYPFSLPPSFFEWSVWIRELPASTPSLSWESRPESKEKHLFFSLAQWSRTDFENWTKNYHSPTSSASERASERSEQCGLRTKRTSERISEWPIINSSISKGPESLCQGKIGRSGKNGAAQLSYNCAKAPLKWFQARVES